MPDEITQIADDLLLAEDGSPRGLAIDRVAASLAKLCRFGGRGATFFSVAQHSVEVSYRAEAEAIQTDWAAHSVRLVALWGLIHDAAEAWLGDLVRPLKRILWVSPPLRKIEALEMELLGRVAAAVGLIRPNDNHWVIPQVVLRADDRCMVTEARDLGLPHVADSIDAKPYPEPIEPVDWRVAEDLFAGRFLALTGGKTRLE